MPAVRKRSEDAEGELGRLPPDMTPLALQGSVESGREQREEPGKQRQ